MIWFSSKWSGGVVVARVVDGQDMVAMAMGRVHRGHDPVTTILNSRGENQQVCCDIPYTLGNNKSPYHQTLREDRQCPVLVPTSVVVRKRICVLDFSYTMFTYVDFSTYDSIDLSGRSIRHKILSTLCMVRIYPSPYSVWV